MARPSTLAHEIHKRQPFDLVEEEAFLNLIRTQAVLSGEFARLFKTKGLSEATYNVLRILRGAGPCGRMCVEIGDHMVAQVPDVTRLVDRLEQAGLAARARTDDDRRVVRVTITPAGLAVLSELDEPVRQLHQQQLGHLTRDELKSLNDLLVKARHGPRELPAAPATDPTH